LGEAGSPRFHVLLIWLADLYILFNVAIAGLKAILELKLAQLLLRSVTVGSVAVYSLFLACFPRLIRDHYHSLIWSVYFGITAVLTVVALRRFLGCARFPGNGGDFGLPPDFWRYTLALQASSVLGFLSTKLDYLFILNAGGLVALGRYVALMTLVSIAPMFATFVLDSYLPSLATFLSANDMEGCERLTRTYVRLIVLLGAGALAFMSVFAEPFVKVLGPQYNDLEEMLRMALPFAGIQIANWIIGTVYSGIGHPHRDALAKALRAVLFVIVFWPLWMSAQFRGAIWAWGIAEVGYQILGLWLLHRIASFKLSLYSAYIPMVVICLALRYLGGRARFSIQAAFLFWSVSLVAFLILGRYSIFEISIFWRVLLSGKRVADSQAFQAAPALENALGEERNRDIR
jgi:O-antigen/teichoic acid export membrane protein